jgi:hypothetical protein
MVMGHQNISSQQGDLNTIFAMLHKDLHAGACTIVNNIVNNVL